MSLVAKLVLLAGVLMALVFGYAWYRIERDRGAKQQAARARTPGIGGVLLGFVTNFFDTLGIGSFASTTAYLQIPPARR